jgi:16S rRNA (cytosine1402-N4)-methyltransferase
MPTSNYQEVNSVITCPKDTEDTLYKMPAKNYEHYNPVHTPVLLNEVLQYLDIKRDGVYVDCTIGEGGHAEAILEKISGSKGLLIGLDKDTEALKIAEKSLSEEKKNFILIKDNFLNLPFQLKKLEINKVDGLLFDFGVSSLQFDNPSRGFSFRNNGPLDMRFDAESALTCKELVNEASYSELCEILRNFGEERRASLIARRIVQRREKQPFKTTFELSELASKAIGRGKGRIDPATRTFQAFRIAVNKELESIKKILTQIPDLLKEGGRVCIISYHSLEDRLVKTGFKSAREKGLLKIITKKPVRPSREEIFDNPRSRSAKLRVAEGMNPVRKYGRGLHQ